MKIQKQISILNASTWILSEYNPSKDYMEFGEWFLNHRTEEKLIKLAKSAGIKKQLVTVDKEQLGVNLFLRIKKM